MQEKTGEACRVLNLFRSERIGAVAVFYNGISITSAADSGIDCGEYEDALFVLNVGTVLGQRASLLNSVWQSDSDNPTAAIPVTGASFTTVNSGSTEATQLGNLKVSDVKPYLWLKSEVQNAFEASETATIDFGAQVVLGGSYKKPVSNTLIFDV
jgi:hypothetical protein